MLAAIAALVAVAAPGGAFAAAHQVSITAVPNPIHAGDPMVIVGHLSGSPNANQKVNLFHHLPGQNGFSFVEQKRTDSNGNYVFTRKAGVVMTNRQWFVRSDGAQSRTVKERVHSLVTLSASPTNAKSNQPVVFTGHVTPNHRGDRVYLQRQVGRDGDDWRTIANASDRLDRNSNYRIVRRFRVPDPDGFTVRAVIRRDERNLAGASRPVDLTVQQNQNPKFTINASADPISFGQSVTLSGNLAAPNNALRVVVLYAHQHNQGYHSVATTTTDPSGNYSFTRMPAHNTVYQVRTVNQHRRTAQVFEAVRDVIGPLTVTPSDPKVGEVVSIKGSVAPDKAGHRIELQKLGRDGDYRTIEQVRVQRGSTFEFLIRFGVPGAKKLRVHISGGPVNWGANSAPVTVNVSPGAAPTGSGPTTSS